jgi:capping protein beta
MNNAFDQYRELYYDGGVCSVYLWETTEDFDSFAGSILFKKAGLGSQKIKGCWDSIHVFEVSSFDDSVSYKLTTTVMLWLQTNTDDSGLLNLGGSLTRQFDKKVTKYPGYSHICEIGKLIEETENKIRTSLQTIYFGKTRDVVNSLRSPIPLSERDKNRAKLAAELGSRVAKDSKM